ncbi:efflux RND transporter periplasmic adaptor subunit [Desulfoscipio gibsoniae]
MKKLKLNKVVMSISAVILLTFMGSFIWRSLQTDSTPVIANHKTSVQVEQARESEKITQITYNATLEPVEEGIVSSKATGEIVRILFEDGDQVVSGQALAELDDQDLRNQLNAAEIAVQKLEANLQTTQGDYDRTKVLFENGAVAQVDYENAVTSLKLVKADLETAKISRQSISAALESCVIRAPISGVMDEKNINIGQMISPGLIIAKVKNITSLYAVVQIKQQDINKIQIGQRATIRNEDSAAEGLVKALAVSADSLTRVFRCKIEVDNKNKLFHPGDYAKVAIISDQKAQMITLPLEALAGDEGNYFIMVDDTGIARRRSVTIGEIMDNNRLEIKSGVRNGESVIYTNINMLQDGDEIAVVSGQGENQ